jgi:hypothetical protein
MLILTILTHCVPCLLQHEKLQSAPGSRVGTPAYLAPEVILTTKGKTYDGKVAIHLQSVNQFAFLVFRTHQGSQQTIARRILRMPSNTLKHSSCALALPACCHAALLYNYQHPYNEGSGPSISYPQGTSFITTGLAYRCKYVHPACRVS